MGRGKAAYSESGVRYQVHIRPEAEEDLRQAYTWYEEQQPGLGEQFLLAVERALASIQQHPLGYTELYRHVRRALTRRFPFAVFFLLQDHTIIVLAVLHGSRHPRTWHARLGSG